MLTLRTFGDLHASAGLCEVKRQDDMEQLTYYIDWLHMKCNANFVL